MPRNRTIPVPNGAMCAIQRLLLYVSAVCCRQSRSSCGEVFLNQTYGDGDYTFVVATNPVNVR